MFSLFLIRTNLILRISGYPKLNYLRKKLWKKSNKIIYKVTSPTQELLNDLIDLKIFSESKTSLLNDAILNIEEFISKKNQKYMSFKERMPKNFFLSVGRFTKQKNFKYLVDEFKKFSLNYPDEKLVIIGEGELKNEIRKKIKDENLSDKIFLFSQTENVYYFMMRSKAFILPSLWEEVGFVIVEASMSNSFIISSNCKNGPREFLLSGKAGILFENNEKMALTNSLNLFMSLKEKEIFLKKNLAKKNSIKFSMFRHQILLKKILN